jgi:hypothetical protein
VRIKLEAVDKNGKPHKRTLRSSAPGALPPCGCDMVAS